MIVVPIVMVVLLLVGAPIAFAVLLSGVAFLATPDAGVSMTLAPLRMISSLNNFILIAVPLFIFAGELMVSSGITDRLVRFANYLVGWLQAGLAQVTVAVSMFFGGISGLAMADAAAVGSVMIPALRRTGYSVGFAAALTSAAATVGGLIPPSVAAIIYAVLAGTSIAGLFLASLVPAVILGVSFMVLVAVWARRNRVIQREIEPRPGEGRSLLIERRSFADFLAVTRDALLALLAPVIILLGIFTGVFTATEASAVAVVYTLLLGVAVYRTLNGPKIWAAAVHTARLSGAVLLIYMAADVVGWGVAFAQVPQDLAQVFIEGGSSPLVFLAAVAVFLLFIGTVLEPIPAMAIVVPVLVPAGAALGIDPLQLGVLVVLTLSIGLITPPVGGVLFVTTQIAQVKVESVVRELTRFLLVSVLVIALVVVWPAVSVWLPHLLGFGS